jgi:SecD/SecF fusion protein
MDPSQGVSQSEFDEMVRDLGIEEEEKQPAAARSGRPAGGRRARSRANGGQTGQPQQPPQQQGPPQGDGDQNKPKKPRNRRHGRPR